ncbi:MAG: hypothetical protein V7724_15850 [Sediminicola sp.]
MKNKIIGVPFVLLVLLVLWFFITSLGHHGFQTEHGKKAFTAYIKDSVRVDVQLVYGKNNIPLKYFSHIWTPVCEEGTCYDLIVDVYWDLLGNFLSYKEDPENPFTKFDHIKFSPADHERMQKILADKTSLLANYGAGDLVDNDLQVVSDVLDGLTGATYEPLSGSVVPGAVYSSHTLWHIVNGNVADSIRSHTETLMNDSLLVSMLRSDNYNHQLYALRKVDLKNERYINEVFRLLNEGKSYVPFFAIDALPRTIWASDSYQVRAMGLLEKVGFRMQNEILNRLKGNPLDDKVLSRLILNINVLEPSQVEKAFTILDSNKGVLGNDSLKKMATLLNSKKTAVANAAFDLLSTMGGHYPDIDHQVMEYKKENLDKKNRP